MDKYTLKRLEENLTLTKDEATELANYLKFLEAESGTVEKLKSAISGLLKEPYGCPMCDSGKLRNPEKEHWDDCPFMIAEKLLTPLPNREDKK